MDIKKELGSKIKSIRKSKGLTQEQLAELIGIEPPSLSYIETGKFSPSIETLQKLSEVLQVGVWEFYYFETLSNAQMIAELTDAMMKDELLTKVFYNLLMTVKYNRKSKNITIY